MARESKAMTAEELVHDLGAFGLWLFFAIQMVLAMAAVLEALATR